MDWFIKQLTKEELEEQKKIAAEHLKEYAKHYDPRDPICAEITRIIIRIPIIVRGQIGSYHISMQPSKAALKRIAEIVAEDLKDKESGVYIGGEE